MPSGRSENKDPDREGVAYYDWHDFKCGTPILVRHLPATPREQEERTWDRGIDHSESRLKDLACRHAWGVVCVS